MNDSFRKTMTSKLLGAIIERVFLGRTRRRARRGLSNCPLTRRVDSNIALYLNDFGSVGERLEDRTLLAAFAEAGSLLNLNMNVANQSVSVVSAGTSYSLTLNSGAWSGTDSSNVTGSGTSVLTVTTSGLAAFDTINLTDSAAGAGVTFANSGASVYSDNFNVTLDSGPVAAVQFNGNSSFGAFGLNVFTTRNIALNSGANVTTSSGGITLQANIAGTTTGNFSGITLTSANIASSGTGAIQLTGKGGTTLNNNRGVFLTGSASHVTGGSIGTAVSIDGTGGQSSGNANYGVGLEGTGHVVTSSGGNVQVLGHGGGISSSTDNMGVIVSGGGQITAGGSGTVTVTGTGGLTTGTLNCGVYVGASGAKIDSNGGAVLVTGQGGGSGVGSVNIGVNIQAGGRISAESIGTVTVSGTGGGGSGGTNYGVLVSGTGATITSSGGASLVIGQGGGSVGVAGGNNHGIFAQSGGQIAAGGSGTVTITGTGGQSTGNTNQGVRVEGNNTWITSNAGAVQVTGQGGGSGTSTSNSGVIVLSGGQVSAGGGGALAVLGTGGSTSGGSNFGVIITGTGAAVSSAAGAVQVTGLGGGLAVAGGGSNHGVYVQSGGQITSGAGANVSISGTGGYFASSVGVQVQGTGSVTSGGGAVQVVGQGGGSGTGTDNYGVNIISGGQISAGSNGTVSVIGAGGNNSGIFNHGVVVNSGTITSSGGGVSVTGQAGGSGAATGVLISSSGRIVAAGTGGVMVSGTGANISGNAAFNYGVQITGTSSAVTSGGGAVMVTGRGGGSATSSSNHGVYVLSGGQITAGGVGTVTIDGTGGSGSGGNNFGVFLTGANSNITSSGGDVQVAGTPGSSTNSFAINITVSGAISTALNGGATTLIGDTINFDTTAVVNAAMNSVTLKPKANDGTVGINLGGADVLTGSPLTLGLSDAELDRITAAVLRIGDSTAGDITISQPISLPGVGTLDLLAAGALIDGNLSLADVTVTNLTLDTASVGTFSNTLETTVSQLNVVSRSGGIFVTDNDGLTVSNASATGAGINLVAQGPLSLTGNITATETTNLINLSSIGSGSNLTLVAGKTVTGPSVTLRADRMDLAGSVQATLGSVQLNVASSGWGIELGPATDAAADMLELSDAELDRITISDPILPLTVSSRGLLTISSPISWVGTNSLRLLAEGAMIDDNSTFADVTATNLTLDTASVGTFSNTLETAVSQLNVVSRSGGVFVTDNDGLTVSSASATGGGITLVAQGPLSLTGNITATATTSAINLDSIGGASNLSLVAGKTLSGPSVTMQADRMDLSGSVQATLGSVQLNAISADWGVNLGSATDVAANTLELSDAELDRIIAGTIRLGNSTTGNVTISAPISRTDSTTLEIVSGGTIGDTCVSTPDVTASRLTILGTVAPGMSPGILSVAGDVVFADNDVFQVDIGGATAGTNINNHDQLAVTGFVTIGGNVTLSASPWMAFEPTLAESYTIIQRTGGTGTFANLPEGATITNFLGSSLAAVISYVGGTGNDVVLTTVSSNQRPTITSNGSASAASISLPENTSAVTTVTATDPDAGQTLTFSISGGTDSAKFTIDGASGVLAFAPAPNFESPNDTGISNDYDVTVQVSDGNGGLDTQAISVTVTNVNEAPTEIALSNSGIDENQPMNTVVGTLAAIDPDTDDTFTYSLVPGTGSEGNAAFTIVGNVIKTAVLVDYETQDFFSIHVQASDAGGLSFEQVFLITVNNANDNSPVATNRSFTTTANAPVSSNVPATDGDFDSLVFIQLVPPMYGQLSFAADGSFTYTPNVAFVGVDSFTFHASDGAFTSNVAQITIDDRSGASQVAFKANQQGVAENVGTVSVTASLSQVSGQDVTIPLVFSGSAKKFPAGDVDYTLSNGSSLIIPAWSLTATYSFNIVDDATPELAETIVLSMGTPLNAVLSTTSGAALKHTVTIQASDAPSVTFSKVKDYFVERSSNPHQIFVPGYGYQIIYDNFDFMTIYASLSSSVDFDVYVPLSFQGSTANASDYSLYGGDFTVFSNVPYLKFAARKSTAELVFRIVDDALVEPLENLVIRMTQPQDQSVLLGKTPTTTVGIYDNDSPKLRFSTSSQDIWEDEGPATVTIMLDQPALTPVTFRVGLQDGTASSGGDFTIPDNTFTIPADGSTISVQVPISILNDSVTDKNGNETVKLKLLSVNDAMRDSYLQNHTITIKDDDPTVSFVTVGQTPENRVSGEELIYARLSSPTNKSVKVNYSVSKGSATKGTDYTISPSSSVTIAAGLKSAEIAIHLVNDTLVETPETVSIKMGTVTNAIKGTTDATVTIIDDDDPGITFSASKTSVKESGKAVTFTVQLSAAASHDAYVRIEFGGTAVRYNNYTTSGTFPDRAPGYTASDTVVLIPAGETSTTFKITPIDNFRRNADRTVILTLKEPTNAVLARRLKPITITITDDDAPPSLPKPKAPTVNTSTPVKTAILGAGTVAIPDVDPNDPVNWPSPILGDTGDTTYFSISHGYIAGGVAFFDANKNLILDFLDLNGDDIQDLDEPTEVSTFSGNDGIFSLEIPDVFDLNESGTIDTSEGQYVVVGGIDTSTLRPSVAPIVAPVGTYSITPLSTLTATLVNEQGFEVNAAYQRVMEALGLQIIDITTIDVLREVAAGNSDAPELFAAGTALFNTLSQVAGFISGAEAGAPANFVANVFLSNLAAKIVEPNSFLDLSDSTVLESVIQGVLNETGVTMTPELVSGAAAVIAEGNHQLDLVPVSGDTSFLSRIVQIQVVAEGTVTEQLYAVAAGTLDLDECIQNNTGAALLGQINSAIIGDVLPTGLVITNVQQIEGNAGQDFFDFTVALDHASSQTITVDYATEDGLAESADGDYHPASGSLTWTPGDDSAKIIRVAVNGDARFEPGEDFFVVLSNPTNAVVRKDIGQGVLVNDDSFTYQAPADAGANALKLHVDGQYVELFRGEETVIFGNLGENSQFTILAADGEENTLTVELGDQTPVGGTVAFVGSGGTNQLVLQDTSAEHVLHTLKGSRVGNLAIDGLFLQYSEIDIITDGMVPTLTRLPVSSVEGSEIALGVIAPEDDAPERFSYAWNVKKNGANYTTGTGDEFRFIPDNNAYYEVSVTIMADGRGSGTVVGRIQVDNIAPSVVADIDCLTSDEGHHVMNSGTFSDQGADSVSLSASIGTVTPHDDGTWVWDYTPDDNPSKLQIVTITATDSDNAITTISFVLTVTNVAPVVNAGTDQTLSEGIVVTLNGSFTDPGTADTHTQSWSVLASNGQVISVGSGLSYDFTPNDNGIYTVVYTVIDDDGGMGSDMLILTISNLAPLGSIASATTAVRGQTRTFTFGAVDSAADQATGFRYVVNWGDNSSLQTINPTANNGAGIAADHVYTMNGTYTVTVTATDKDGVTGLAVTSTIVVTTMALQPDPLNPGQMMLVVGGSTGNDTIRLSVEEDDHDHNDDDAEFIKVRFNERDEVRHKVRGTFALPVSRVVVYAQAGNDEVKVEDDLAVPAWLYGGDGNDKLKGGEGHDVLLGGTGDDLLSGTEGRDLLIGGTGADRIIGNSGDDILIAGTTEHDNHAAILFLIMKEWTRTDASFLARVSHLRNGDGWNAGYRLTDATVHDDHTEDLLTGSDGNDWFLFNRDGDGGVKDKVTDLSVFEALYALDLDWLSN